MCSARQSSAPQTLLVSRRVSFVSNGCGLASEPSGTGETSMNQAQVIPENVPYQEQSTPHGKEKQSRETGIVTAGSLWFSSTCSFSNLAHRIAVSIVDHWTQNEYIFIAAMSTLAPAAPVQTGSQGPVTIAVSAVLLGMNVFFIGLRCYSSLTAKKFNYNDVLMVIAVGIYAGLLVLLILAVNNGIGRHTSTATLTGIGQSLKFIFFLEIIYVVLTSIMKASLAITLLQWAKSKVHIFLLRTAIFIDFVICIVVVEYFLVQCAPISYTWKLTDPKAKGVCLPATQQLYIGEALSGTTISLDMLFLFVPFFMLRGRGVSTRVKMYIYAIFGLGVAASVANFIRLAALVKLKASKDPLFDAAPVFLWSAVEVSIGISVAGIIELRPLMRRFKVAGFEDSFDQLPEDRQPIRLESMDKSNVGFSSTRPVGSF